MQAPASIIAAAPESDPVWGAGQRLQGAGFWVYGGFRVWEMLKFGV